MTQQPPAIRINDASGAEIGALKGTEELTIGRETNRSIWLNSTAVSRTQGIFAFKCGEWMLRELGSTNGTWINEKQVRGGDWSIVRPGDKIQMADVEMFLEVEPGSQYKNDNKQLILIDGDAPPTVLTTLDADYSANAGGDGAEIVIDGTNPGDVVFTLKYGIGRLGILKSNLPNLVFINDRHFSGNGLLKDRDSIRSGTVRILVSYPELKEIQHQPTDSQTEDLSATSNNEPTFAAKSKDEDDDDVRTATLSLDPERVQRLLAARGNVPPPTNRRSTGDSDGFSTMEKMMLVAIVILILVAGGLVIYLIL